MKELPCEISFSISQSHDKLLPQITIVDRLSRTIICKAELSFEDYAKAVLTSRHAVRGVVSFNDDGTVGKKRESKTEIVWIPSLIGHAERMSEVAKHLKPYEVNGWKAYLDDALNSNNWTKGPKQVDIDCDGHWTKISFYRYVEATEEDIKEVSKFDYE